MKNGDNAQYIKMTEEPVEKLLLSLSVPAIMSMLVTTVYNIVDAAFVGTLGTSQSGAIGIVHSYMAILQSVAFLCGQGSGSIVSRKLGQKAKEEADKFASSGFLLSFSLAFVIANISLIFLTPLVRLLGSTETILPYAKTYVFFILIAAPFFASSLTMNNLLRYEGKAKLGTIGLMTGAVLNIAGDAIFIYIFKLGITGAGLSTAISQTISFSIILSMYLKGKTSVNLSLKNASKSASDYIEIVTTGFPSLLRQSLNAVATMVLNRCASVYGDCAVSAMSVVSRLSFFPMSIAIGIGQGFQPISGFNYGANKKKRVKEAFCKALAGGEFALIAASIPMFIFAPRLITFMRNDLDVIAIGTRALRLICIAQISVPLTMMVEMGFQSTGQKKMAAISSSLRSGVLFIPSLFIFSNIRGLSGIQEAQPFSFVLTFCVSLFFSRIFFKGLSDQK